MIRVPVDSSDLVSVGYDEPARVLEIEFKEGRVYQYYEVAPDIHKGLLRADSYGQYFYAFINGHYRYRRVDHAGNPEQYQALAFVTGNAVKLRRMREACEPLGIEIERLDLPVDEIQSHDPRKIALHKAKQAHKLAKRPVVVNDAFWNILALRGFPGAYMRQIGEWLRAEDFLKLMEDKKDRTAVCTRTIVYYDGKRSKVFSHDMIGTITEEPRGDGPPYTQIVIPPGHTQTIAQLEAAGMPVVDPAASPYHAFAKWYNLQRRLGLAA